MYLVGEETVGMERTPKKGGEEDFHVIGEGCIFLYDQC